MATPRVIFVWELASSSGYLRVALPRFQQHHADNEHRRTPYEEAHVPINALALSYDFVDVVKPKYLVVNYAFHDIEYSPPDQDSSDEEFVRPKQMSPMCGSPEKKQSDHNENISSAVEDAIPQRIQFETGYILDRIPTAQHVVPLKYLMQHNPIKEAAQAEAEKNS
jgi:hypothetical protein